MDKMISKNMAKKNDVWKNLEKTLGQPSDEKELMPMEKKYSNDYSWRTNSGPLDFEPLAPKQTKKEKDEDNDVMHFKIETATSKRRGKKGKKIQVVQS